MCLLVLLRFSQLTVIRTPVEFWNEHQGARVRRSRMFDQTGSEILVESGVHFFGHNRVDAMGLGGDRCSALRYCNLKRHQRPRPKIRFGSGNVRKFIKNAAYLFSGHTGPLRAM